MQPSLDQLAFHLSLFLVSAQYLAAVGAPVRRDRRGRFTRSHPAAGPR